MDGILELVDVQMTPDILRIQMVQELADGKCGDTWDFRSLHYHDKAPTEQGREKKT